MDISIICGLNQYYSELAEAGFNGIDLPLNNLDHILEAGFSDTIMKKYSDAQKAGLKICQTHLPFWPSHYPEFSTYEEYEEFILPRMIRGIELTGDTGCRTAVVHLYYGKEREESRTSNIRLIEKLLPSLEKKNVILSTENIYNGDFGDAFLSSAEDLLFYSDYFASPYVGACLDTGHALIRGQNVNEMLEKLKHKLTALHIHSTVYTDDLHMIPGFMGGVDWKSFAQTVRTCGYKGSFNLEVKPPEALSYKALMLFYRLSAQVARDIIGND